MPQMDTSTWKLAAQERKGEYVIEGVATDVTGRKNINEDTIRLTEEPEFEQGPVESDWSGVNGDVGGILKAVQKIPFGPIRHIDPKKIHTKWQLIEQLTSTIPMNEFDLPEFYYSPDLLDHEYILRSLLPSTDTGPTPSTTISSGEAVHNSLSTAGAQTHIDAAIIRLDYHEGYPSYGGRPFWQRMAVESEAAYDAFEAYLALGGSRKMSDLIAYPIDSVREWFHTYYWGFRVKSFDLYRVVNGQRNRLQRMLQVEDTQFNRATKLLDRIDKAFDDMDEEEWAKIEPEKLVGMMEKLSKIQRISAGLSASGGDDQAGKAAPTSIQITQQVVQNTPQTAQKTEDSVDILTEAPEFAENVQELMIDMMKRSPEVNS
jgi:hypothetical protein